MLCCRARGHRHTRASSIPPTTTRRPVACDRIVDQGYGRRRHDLRFPRRGPCERPGPRSPQRNRYARNSGPLRWVTPFFIPSSALDQSMTTGRTRGSDHALRFGAAESEANRRAANFSSTPTRAHRLYVRLVVAIGTLLPDHRGPRATDSYVLRSMGRARLCNRADHGLLVPEYG
jgi:hypothetical protein